MAFLRAVDGSPHLAPERLHAGGYASQIEATFKARLAGAPIVQVPITFEERRAGVSKMSMAIFVEALLVVLTLRVTNLGRRRRRSLRAID